MTEGPTRHAVAGERRFRYTPPSALPVRLGVSARPTSRPPDGNPTSKETTDRGSSQATRLACPPGRASRAPGAERAGARRMRALSREEAAASRLPQLRLVPGPPGDRAEADRD